MKLERRTKERSGQPLGALLGGLMVVGAVLAAVWLRFELPVPRCTFRQVTGVPCPTCGSTRMVELLLSGRILEAAGMNPFMFSMVAAIVLWAIVSAVRAMLGLPTWQIVFARWERRTLLLLAIAAALVSWAYLIGQSV